jgi:hypothetical protein
VIIAKALNARGIATARGGVWTRGASDRCDAPGDLIESGVFWDISG